MGAKILCLWSSGAYFNYLVTEFWVELILAEESKQGGLKTGLFLPTFVERVKVSYHRTQAGQDDRN